MRTRCFTRTGSSSSPHPDGGQTFMAVYTADVAHLEPRAVGVTAFTVNDAPSILDQELFSGGPRPPVACVVEDVALGVATATRE